MATPFGQDLHVSGTNRVALEAAIAPHRDAHRWTETRPTLEEVFIHMMDAGDPLSFARVMAVLVKEFREMMRGQPSVTLSIPIIQLLLFGYTINDNPHHLPTGVYVQDQGEFARSILAAMHNTGYFGIVATARSPAELDRLMALGKITFSVTIPGDFTRRVVRHDNAQILVEADASDPTETGAAVAALASLPATALAHDLTGAGAPQVNATPFTAVLHNRYNSEAITCTVSCPDCWAPCFP